MAMSKKMLEQEPSEIEMLLPWHAAGTLNARDARRVEEALARDPDLANQYAVIREEYAETIHLNESLGAPSARAMQKLFAAIDGEPVRKPSLSSASLARISEFFARPFAAHAGLVGEPRRHRAAAAGRRDRRRTDEGPDLFQTASLSMNEPSPGRSPAISAARHAAARAGAVCAGGADFRHQGAARQLSGLHRRRRQGRHVPPAVRQQGDGQGRGRGADEQAAAARRSSASRWQTP